MDTTMTGILSPNFTVSETKVDEYTSVLVFEPLEQGYGHTLGNALRRVLLSSLPGHAVTQFRIEGVDHLFSAVKGTTEDVLGISLNIKQLKLKGTSDDDGTLTVSVKGPKVVTAADIDCSAGYEVVNKDQIIATVSKGHQLDMEMTAEKGLGYILASDKKSQMVGDIPVDSLFSPIVTVSYKVEATRVGRRTDYDRLSVTIETNGSILPVDALKQAAHILTQQFSQIITPTSVTTQTQTPSLSPEEAEVMRLTVEELDLPTRIANALRKGGFATVGDLVGAPKTIIAKVKNLGEKSVSVVDGALQKKGVSLGE